MHAEPRDLTALSEAFKFPADGCYTVRLLISVAEISHPWDLRQHAFIFPERNNPNTHRTFDMGENPLTMIAEGSGITSQGVPHIGQG